MGSSNALFGAVCYLSIHPDDGESWVAGPTILAAERKESVIDKSPKRQDVVKDSPKESRTLIPALCYAI